MNRTPVADWQQLSALYEQADALDPVALDAWLGELRRLPHPLLPQLEQMLEARVQIRHNGFLGALPQFPLAPEPRPTEWQADARIGPYRLQRRLGAGGMAEVWLADRDDGAFRRQVAVKLLFRQTGARDRNTFARRFERERDILASLDHPHIARLHDAGVTPGGQPWLALEYVEGQSLTAWCDAQRLTPRARVELFRQVLLAVQHAHANLVIHRDLKPGNILVSADGQVRLLDFGIAKLMEREGGESPLAATELTRLAGPPMTPEYASPEQLAGQPLNTGSDIYSLGVVLYELLCGERPYELKVATPAQLEQAILETEPRAPSRRAILEPVAAARGSSGPDLRRTLANDLDAIVLRALAKRPTDRYASVEALRADLDRWLDGLPVEARAPTRLYRANKFVRRHVLAVTLGTAAVSALVAVTVAAVSMGLQARQESARALAARDFMLNIFKLAEQEKSRGTEITARDVLDRGRKDVMTRLAGQPRLQAELLDGVMKVQQNMGEYAAADATSAELVRTLEAARETREAALARLDRASNALAMNRADLARHLFDETQAGVGAALFADESVKAALAQVSGLLALDAGDAEKARPLLENAYDRAERKLGDSDLRTYGLGQALVRADRDLGRVDAALLLQERLRRTASAIPSLGADAYADLDWEQFSLLSRAGRYAAALRLSDQALPRCVAALGARYPGCRYLAVESARLARVAGWAERAAQALPELMHHAEDANLPFLQIDTWLIDLALQAQAPASPARADAVLRVQRFADASNQDGPLRASAALGLASAALRGADVASAERWIQAALSMVHERLGQEPASPVGAHAQMLWGLAQLEGGQVAAALPLLQTARRFMAAVYGGAHPQTQFATLDVALALERLGRLDEAAASAAQVRAPLGDSLGAE
ncbi:MAG: protein kinase, partial [Pseudomonadota bacterium]|nr:protein kinase [Pseudomonadota bacterium]